MKTPYSHRTARVRRVHVAASPRFRVNEAIDQVQSLEERDDGEGLLDSELSLHLLNQILIIKLEAKLLLELPKDRTSLCSSQPANG